MSAQRDLSQGISFVMPNTKIKKLEAEIKTCDKTIKQLWEEIDAELKAIQELLKKQA